MSNLENIYNYNTKEINNSDFNQIIDILKNSDVSFYNKDNLATTISAIGLIGDVNSERFICTIINDMKDNDDYLETRHIYLDIQEKQENNIELSDKELEFLKNPCYLQTILVEKTPNGYSAIEITYDDGTIDELKDYAKDEAQIDIYEALKEKELLLAKNLDTPQKIADNIDFFMDLGGVNLDNDFALDLLNEACSCNGNYYKIKNTDDLEPIVKVLEKNPHFALGGLSQVLYTNGWSNINYEVNIKAILDSCQALGNPSDAMFFYPNQSILESLNTMLQETPEMLAKDKDIIKIFNKINKDIKTLDESEQEFLNQRIENYIQTRENSFNKPKILEP